MLQKKFRSNETIPLGVRKDEWMELKIRGVEPRFEKGSDPKDSPIVWYDEMLKEKSREIFEAIRELRVIENYKYVITYLLDYFAISLEPELKKAYFSYIAEVNLKKILPLFDRKKDENYDQTEESFLRLTAHLSACVRKAYFAQGFELAEEEKNWETYFEKLVKRFQADRLRELALGLHIPPEEANMFYRKVLKRTGFNFYDPAEACLYLVLTFGGQRDYFSKYKSLMSIYRNAVDAYEGRELEMIPDQKINTKELGSRLDSRTKQILQGLESEEALFCEENDRLSQWFGWIGKLRRKKKMRTVDEMFWDQLEALRALLAKSYDYWLYVEDEAFMKYKNTYESRNDKSVVVWYENGREIRIPAGTKVTGKVKIGTGTATAEFTVIGDPNESGDVVLPAMEYEWIPVKVECLELKSKLYELAKRKVAKREWKSGNFPQFVKTSHLSTGFCVETPEYQSLVQAIEVGGKVRFDSDSKDEPGTIFVKCPCGTWIKEGTIFYFEEEEVKFCYQVVEDANTEICTIPVIPLTIYEKSDEVAAKKSDAKAKAKQEMFFDEECVQNVQGVVSISTGKSGKLSLYAGNSKNNVVEVRCCQTCRIPKDTILYLVGDGKVYHYKTIDEFEQKPFAKATINLRWMNSEELWKKKDEWNKGRFTDEIETELIESGADLSLNREGILRVFTQKRMLAYPEMNEQNLWEETKRRLKGRVPAYGYGHSSDAGLISNNSMLEYLYDAPAANLKYYQGIKSEGENFFLNTTLFKETRLTNNVLMGLTDSDERKRNLLLSLIFLQYVLENELEEEDSGDDSEQRSLQEYGEEILNEFTYCVDKIMSRCGLQTLNGGNPYDAFLSMLLFCDDPFSMFQDIWSERHPFADYVEIQYPMNDENEVLQVTLSDSENACIHQWSVKENGEIYSTKNLDRKNTYRVTITCQKKNGKKIEELWRVENAFIPSEDRMTLIEVKKDEKGNISLK